MRGAWSGANASSPRSSIRQLEVIAGRLCIAAHRLGARCCRPRYALGGRLTSDPGDDAILDFAQREARILITLDKDFGELAVAFGQPHCGIVRLVDIDPSRQAPVCEEVLARHGADLAAGAIVTVTPDRMRLRPAEAGDLEEEG